MEQQQEEILMRRSFQKRRLHWSFLFWRGD